jgi:DNA-binding SARP family transcriptional activator
MSIHSETADTPGWQRRVRVSPGFEPLRVFTLGRFRIERDGEPAVLGRRAPPRQLELLQALIALGGTTVAQAGLADALWPDAEGDASMHALETTLYRLRRTFGAEAIGVCAGQVSLNCDLWWVDLVAFRALASEIESALIEGRAVQPGLANRLFDVYRGDFLPGVEAPWAVATRRLQRSRMSALCARLSRSWASSATAVLAESVRHRAAERVPAEIAVSWVHGPL